MKIVISRAARETPVLVYRYKVHFYQCLWLVCCRALEIDKHSWVVHSTVHIRTTWWGLAKITLKRPAWVIGDFLFPWVIGFIQNPKTYSRFGEYLLGTSIKPWLLKMRLWLGIFEIIMYQPLVDFECSVPCYLILEYIPQAHIYDSALLGFVFCLSLP